ncbi:IPT/TIG domain-containing protein [Nocardia rhamnosiphila]
MPTITSLSPTSGPTAGGTSVTITGPGFPAPPLFASAPPPSPSPSIPRPGSRPSPPAVRPVPPR